MLGAWRRVGHAAARIIEIGRQPRGARRPDQSRTDGPLWAAAETRQHRTGKFTAQVRGLRWGLAQGRRWRAHDQSPGNENLARFCNAISERFRFSLFAG
jgi:hypothetical protein